MTSSACLLTYNVRPLVLSTSTLDWFEGLPTDIYKRLYCAKESPPQLVVEIYYQSGARYVPITATPVVVRGATPQVSPSTEDVFIFGKYNTKTCAAVLMAPLWGEESWNDLQRHCVREENRFVEIGAFLSQHASFLGGSDVCQRYLEVIGCMNEKVSFGLQENFSKETAKKCGAVRLRVKTLLQSVSRSADNASGSSDSRPWSVGMGSAERRPWSVGVGSAESLTSTDDICMSRSDFPTWLHTPCNPSCGLCLPKCAARMAAQDIFPVTVHEMKARLLKRIMTSKCSKPYKVVVGDEGKTLFNVTALDQSYKRHSCTRLAWVLLKKGMQKRFLGYAPERTWPNAHIRHCRGLLHFPRSISLGLPDLSRSVSLAPDCFGSTTRLVCLCQLSASHVFARLLWV